MQRVYDSLVLQMDILPDLKVQKQILAKIAFSYWHFDSSLIKAEVRD